MTRTASCRGCGPWSGSRARTRRSRPRRPPDWRERWAAEGARYGQAPLPADLRRRPERRVWRSTAPRRRPRLPRPRPRAPCAAPWCRGCSERRATAAGGTRWRRRSGTAGPDGNPGARPRSSTPSIEPPGRGSRSRRASSRRPMPAIGHALVAAALADGAHVSAAVVPSADGERRDRGRRALSRRPMASCSRWAWHPDHRRKGLAGRLLAASRATLRGGDRGGTRPHRPARSGHPGRRRAGAARRRCLPARTRRSRALRAGRSPRDPGDALMAPDSASGLPAKDLVDVRLSDAFGTGGCPICAVRARSERAMLDTIIAERVLDIPFRESLERTQGFCRRHVAELVLADRRGPGGILGSSILYGAMLDRRLEPLRGALGRRGRSLRTRFGWCPEAAAMSRLRPGRERRRHRAGTARGPDRGPGLGGGHVDRAVLSRRPRRPLDRRGRRRRLRADRPAPGRNGWRRFGRDCRVSWTTRLTIGGT